MFLRFGITQTREDAAVGPLRMPENCSPIGRQRLVTYPEVVATAKLFSFHARARISERRGGCAAYKRPSRDGHAPGLGVMREPERPGPRLVDFRTPSYAPSTAMTPSTTSSTT